jgi:shikimate dehydrogenase
MISHLQHRCAVVGTPVRHSLSPALHRAGYAAVGLDWEYDAFELRAEELAGFVRGLDDSWRGLSLTMPLKRTVVPLVDELTERAGQAQAVNTLILDEGLRVGHNTDIPGAVAAITERVATPVRRAVILGGGATATSTLLALADLGCGEITLVVRDEARARETLAAAARHPAHPAVIVRDFSMRPPEVDLLVSTIPATAQAGLAVRLAERVPAIFDVIYDPWPTDLATFAGAEGRALVAGLDLLVHQAGGQFTLMTGVADPPLEIMRRAGEAELSARSRPGRNSPERNPH